VERRPAWWAPVAGAAYVLVVLALLAAATRGDRYPLPALPAVLALVAPGLGAGLLGRSWWLLALVPVPALAGFGLAYLAGNPWLPLIAGLLLALVTLLTLPLGVAVARRSGHARLPVAGAVVLASALVVVPLAVAQRERTVTVDRPDPLALDEEALTFRGAGVDDPVVEVRRRLGRGERVAPDDPRRRGVGPDVTTGPSSLSTSGDELRYGRDVAFLLDDRGRVEYVMVADERARTRRGVGPGDSMARFRDAYPGMRCREGSIGSDTSSPFPQCSVRLRPGRFLYVAGTYDLPGAPAVVVMLSRRPVIG
jgi:hypothetical protein